MKKIKEGNEFDALTIGILFTIIFYSLLWIIFNLGLEMPDHRIYRLLGGQWPYGIIQFITFLSYFWAMIILGSKLRVIIWEKNALLLDLLPQDENRVLLPDQINELRHTLSERMEWKDSIFIKTLSRACTKFRANKSIQETMDVIKIQTEMDLNFLESSFGIIKYLAWSIPSIGFIGTVIGISGALAKADEAAAGDISAVTIILGTAFDTTLISLILSILLMFQVHRVQQKEELLIFKIQNHIIENFINKIYIPREERA